MARIAYVDHSYHKKTRSNYIIIPQVLIEHGHTVDYFWDESWRRGAAVPWNRVCDYDAIIMFQSFCPIQAKHFRSLHPNVTYIPMLDQFGACNGPLQNLYQFWEPFRGSKVLNFSHSAHIMTLGFGIKSHYVKFYKPPLDKPTAPKEGLHGFFWMRREEQIPWHKIRKLIGNTRFESLHLHLASDPGSPKPTLPSREDYRRLNITQSGWIEKKEDFNRVLEKANIYFAPRKEEGIGQSFLEAFRRGQCVVAADNATMNEYILHGVNGYLYDSNDPKPLDFSHAVEMGRIGWQASKEGYACWEAAKKKMLDFILTPSHAFYPRGLNFLCHTKYNDQSLVQLRLKKKIRDLQVVRRTRNIWQPLWYAAHDLKTRMHHPKKNNYD